MRKLTLRLGRNDQVTITVPDRTALPLRTLAKLVLHWETVGGREELRVSPSTAVAAGYGRSLVAAILGLNYKSARRISRMKTSFTFEDFADPSSEKRVDL